MCRAAIYFSFATVVLGARLPPEISQCKSSDIACLKSGAESAFSKLAASGNKEFGILPLDPLNMGTFSVEPKPGPISVYQKYIDVTNTGISKSKVKEFMVDLKACRMNMELVVPMLVTTSKYELKGQLLLFPVDAKGDMQGKMKNLAVHADATCETFKEQDVEYLRVTSTKITFTPEHAELRLGNLINGNEQLEKEVHKIIDDDPIAFFEVVRPAIEHLFSDLLKRTMNNIFQKVPKKDLFKD